MVSIPVVILCGGRGLRMGGNGCLRPKPLAMVGDRPILWHVMTIFATQGHSEFILCLGERGTEIELAVNEFPEVESGLWKITCVDTGDETPTGGRLSRVSDQVDSGTFFLTYSDGLANIDLEELLQFHLAHGRSATVTLVRPHSPWGLVTLGESSKVEGFHEKPVLDHWINGGFFCIEPASLNLIEPDDVLERESMTRLTDAGELHGYRHTGFWECMDTYKDTLLLNDMVDRGEVPWHQVVKV